MPETQAIFYRDRAGREPVDNFIQALPAAAQVAIDNKIDLLNGLAPHAPPLPFPHSSQVRGDLRELRCHYGRTLYRVLYRRSRNLFVLLHIIEKRSGKIPEQDVAVAEERFADLRRRMEARPRRRPRALGHDAPPNRRRPSA